MSHIFGDSPGRGSFWGSGGESSESQVSREVSHPDLVGESSESLFTYFD